MHCQKRVGGWLSKGACKTKAWLRLEQLDRSDKVVEDLTYCPIHLQEWMRGSDAYWLVLGGDEWSSYKCRLKDCDMPATFRLEVPEYMRAENAKFTSHYLCKPHVRPFLINLLTAIVDAIDARRGQ